MEFKLTELAEVLNEIREGLESKLAEIDIVLDYIQDAMKEQEKKIVREITEKLFEMNENALLVDGFDEALVGIAERPGIPPVALYDQIKMIGIMMENEKLDWEDAEEYLEMNVFCAWMGENTPVFAFYPAI